MMSGQTLRELYRAKRLGAERIALRCKTKRVHAYIGGQGDGNLGDDAIYECALALCGASLTPAGGAPREDALRLTRLSGRPFFAGCLVGGGTLINDSGPWLQRAQYFFRQGLPIAFLGTGVGSSGVDQNADESIAAWLEILRSSRHIGLRGPRSLRKLQDAGVENAQVIGDLAYQAYDAEAFDARRKGTGPDVNGFILALCERADEQNEQAIAYAEALQATGSRPILLAMKDADIEPLTMAAERLGVRRDEIVLPSSVEQAGRLFKRTKTTIAVRLHAAILSCCFGSVPILFPYREKLLDFAEDLGIENLLAPPPDMASPAEHLERIVETYHELLSRLEDRLQERIAKQRAFAQSLLTFQRVG